MKIIMTPSEKLPPHLIEEINGVVSKGFGADPSAMLADTKKHIASADTIQLLRLEDGSAGAIAMYRRCLWRQGC